MLFNKNYNDAKFQACKWKLVLLIKIMDAKGETNLDERKKKISIRQWSTHRTSM